MEEINDVGKQIQMISRKIRRRLDTTFLNYGLTGVQASMLKFINDKSRSGKVYAKDIENEFDMRRATIAGIMQLMEQNKLIERKAEGADARLKEIVITKKALDIVNNINLSIQKVEKDLKDDISKEEISTFINILNKLSNNLNKKGENIDD